MEWIAFAVGVAVICIVGYRVVKGRWPAIKLAKPKS